MDTNATAKYMKVYRPSWVEVNLENLKHNCRTVKQLVGENVKIAAVVKANGYGHGAVQVSKACLEAGADFLTVAVLSEAVELREAGFTCPILIMGWTPIEGYAMAIEQELRLTIYNQQEAEKLNRIAIALGKRAKVHLKLDTGMSRLGFQADEAGLAIAEAVLSMEGIEVEGLFSHLSKGDEYDKTFAQGQVQKFKSFMDELEARTGRRIPICHLGASACIIDIPEGHFDMVRPGIMLYGYQPSNQMHYIPHLKPALTWKARVAHIKTLPAGRLIGYNGTFELYRDTLVATIPVGYADGYNRMLSNNGYVICRGKKLPIIGKVCMDQFMVDASELPDMQPGDEVILLGTADGVSITVSEMAQHWGTIEHEVTCSIASRVPRVYIE
ncbi:MAG: alanine racemase [Peptococcaceae bacterium]|nr:alanine racemase [Peptococcaceae bacterium]MBO5114616.1 alanine racemase [Peptococcaceae bacterium]MBO5300674.1 alanine racemase [Peptococcaceae bacterium]MBO5366453.1 alanine racemase [Peptococcaceae bacterium]MBP3584640.1 alanine racemase [Peptococcaceae bacterium]